LITGEGGRFQKFDSTALFLALKGELGELTGREKTITRDCNGRLGRKTIMNCLQKQALKKDSTFLEN